MKNRQLAASYEGWLDYIDKRLRFKYLAFKILDLEHSIKRYEQMEICHLCYEKV